MDAIEEFHYCIPTDGIYCSGCSWSEGVSYFNIRPGQNWLFLSQYLSKSLAVTPTCTGTCYDGECSGLHEDPQVRSEQLAWARPARAKLVIAAGHPHEKQDL
jgi:hypothetical protein